MGWKIIVALIMWAVLPAVIWWLPENLMTVLILLMIGWGLYELTRLKLADPVERVVVMLGSLAFSTIFVFAPQNISSEIALIMIFFVFALTIMGRAKSMDGVAERLGFSAMCLVYLGISMPFWIFLRGMENGQWLMLLVLASAGLADSLAYLIGSAIGKHKFAPMVSPKKTFEGFFGALLGSALGTGVIFYLGFENYAWWHAAAISVIVWITAPFGDLVESMMKRSFGVKDSGSVLRGHGGILDRLDALIFSGPAVYAYVKYVMM